MRDDHAVDAWIRSIEPDRRTAAAIELLQSEPVERVARHLGLSARQLQRSIVTNVGLTPKTLQRVMRMQRFLDFGASRAYARNDKGRDQDNRALRAYAANDRSGQR